MILALMGVSMDIARLIFTVASFVFLALAYFEWKRARRAADGTTAALNDVAALLRLLQGKD